MVTKRLSGNHPISDRLSVLRQLQPIISELQTITRNRHRKETLRHFKTWRSLKKLCQILGTSYPGCRTISGFYSRNIPSVDQFLRAFSQSALHNTLHMKWLQNKETEPPTKRTQEQVTKSTSTKQSKESRQKITRFNKRWMLTNWPSRRKQVVLVQNERDQVPISARDTNFDAKYMLVGIGR